MERILRFKPEDHTYWLMNGEDDPFPVEVPSVTTALKALSAFASRVPTQKSEDARNLGSAVHLTCHYDDLGVLVESSLDDRLRPYLGAYRAFKREHAHEWEQMEQPAYHPDLFYAGTPDRAGTIDGLRVVCDLKTGSDYPTYPLQLAAYAHLVTDPPQARVGLFLRPDGTYQLKYFPESELADDFRVFCSALAVYQWKRRHGIG